MYPPAELSRRRHAPPNADTTPGTQMRPTVLILFAALVVVALADAHAHGSHGSQEELERLARPVQGMAPYDATLLARELAAEREGEPESWTQADARGYERDQRVVAALVADGIFTDPLPVLRRLVHEAPLNPKHRALTTLCSEGSREACFLVGVMYAHGRVVPRRLDLAHALFGYSCAHGVALACTDLGGRTYFGQLLPANVESAAAYLEPACNGGSAGACYLYGVIVRDGLIGEPDADAGAALIARACEEGYERACEHRDSGYVAGTHARSLPETASADVERFARRCDHRFERGCFALGVALRDGVPPRPERGWRLINEACHRGVQEACDEFLNGDRYTRRDREGNPVPLPEVF